MYQVDGKEFDDWTLAQDQAVQLLNDGHEYVNILQWSDDNKSWGLLQELNLERGIKGDTFSTQVLAPYYVRLRGL